eukprot:gene26137-biopygen27044
MDHVSAQLQEPWGAHGTGKSSPQVHALDLAVPRALCLCLAWDEMSPAEQTDALEQKGPVGHRTWKTEGLLRLRSRQRGSPAEESLAVIGSTPSYPWATGDVGGNSVGVTSAAVSAMGTIPGSGGNIPGMPDAWCSLYRVHQYREQQAAVTPAEVRQDLFGEQQERHKSREATELGADVPVAAMEDEPRLRDSSPEVDDIDLTQQLARANDPQQVDPAVPDAAGDDDSEDESDENLEAGVGRCKRILCGGGVLWTAHLAAAHDEDGALLLVFYAYLRGKRVKVLVDSGASDNFVSEECAKRCGLRVQNGPRMKVDVVLGGKWLRSLSPIVLDYSGHGSVSFARRTKGGGKELVTIAGRNPGKSAGGRGGDCAGLIDEVFFTAVQLWKHLLYAETRRLAGDTSCQPAWLMMARRDGGEHESAYAATATGDHPDSDLIAADAEAVDAACLSVETVADAAETHPVRRPEQPTASAPPAKLEPPDTGGTAKDIPQDTKDAKVSPHWRAKFQALFEEFSEELRDALPDISKLRRSLEDEARVTLKADKEGGPPFRRPYHQPNNLRLVVDYRQLNSQTVRDRYPLPDIQLMFDEMQGATHFSSFDAVDGFWQVPMAEEDVEKTAF